MEAIALLLLIVGLLVMGITISVFIYWSDIKSPSLLGSSFSSSEWRSEARARWLAPQARKPLASIGWHVVCASGALDQEKVGGR